MKRMFNQMTCDIRLLLCGQVTLGRDDGVSQGWFNMWLRMMGEEGWFPGWLSAKVRNHLEQHAAAELQQVESDARFE